MAQEPTTRCSGGGTEQEIISSILSEVLEFQVSCSQIRRNITSGNKRLKAGVEVSEGASTNTYLQGGAARAAARALPRGAQEGNEAASLHPLELVLEACAT